MTDLVAVRDRGQRDCREIGTVGEPVERAVQVWPSAALNAVSLAIGPAALSRLGGSHTPVGQSPDSVREQSRPTTPQDEPTQGARP